MDPRPTATARVAHRPRRRHRGPAPRVVAPLAALVLLATLVVGGATAPAARAGVAWLPIEVDTTDDVVDPADGLTSLREAIDEANGDGGPSDVILQDHLTYLLDDCSGGTDESANVGGDLDHLEADQLRITGNGSTIRQTCDDERVLHSFNGGSHLVLADVTITGGDAANGSGGGAFAAGSLALLEAVVEGNRALGANGGGGVAANVGLSANGAVVRHNAAPGPGGGVRAFGPVDLHASTLQHNLSLDAGGAIWTDSTLDLQRSTVTQNQAGTWGGAIRTGDDAELGGSTVVANRAPDAANVWSDGGLDLSGTVLGLGSGAPDCRIDDPIQNGGGNVGYDASCGPAGPDDLNAIHPMLGVPQRHGAPSHSMRPAVGSPVLDRFGPPCVGAVDQRGVARPQGPACDSGSYEGPAEPCTPTFTDVPADHPFFTEVCWLDQTGITSGFGDGSFGAATPVSRQAMAAFLHRLALSPPVVLPGVPTFSDVPDDHPFFREVEWLDEEGVSTGYPDGTFRPVDPVSRQAMAAFLHRVAGEPAFPPPGTPSFDDVPVGHPFFDEIEWMAHEEVSTGYADGTWKPAVPVSRQAMAAFLQRLAEGVRLEGL